MSGSQQLLLAAVQQALPDPNFEYTTLLLPGNGTNGAQNNTFLDSSANAFTVTRNGNTTQGTFSPFSQTGWSNYFDGTGDYLSLASNAAFALPGAFTFECWFYPTAFGQTASWGDTIFTTTATNGIVIARPTSGTSNTWGVGQVGVAWIILSSTLPVNNQWNHIVVVRDSSNNISLFLNGTRLGTTTSAASFAQAAVTIGSDNNAADSFIDGYLSNVRLVKGTAVYDPTASTLTIPTAPLTAITNTSLLTCQSNRFVDNSSNSFAITRNGDVSVQAFSPFNPTAAWSAATNGGSGYFDGSGDELSAASNAAFNLSSGAWTVEAWIYPTTSAGYRTIISGRSAIWEMGLNTGTYQLYFFNGSLYTTTATVTPNAWNHVALSSNGTDIKMYINGVLDRTVTASPGSTATAVYIGGANTVQYFTGYIADARIVKGTQVYPSAFTPPTAPLTAIANTSLLTNFTNAGVYDATSKNDLETVGNAQISTTQSKFGGSSIYLDGTGDWINGPVTPNFNLSSGNWTIEGWYYPTSYSVGNNVILLIGASGADKIVIATIGTSGHLYYLLNGSTVISTTSAGTVNSWSHFALVKNGATTTLYLNGTSIGTTASVPTSSSKLIQIGTDGGGAPYVGYLQDIRVTNGIARYTAAFTPPATAFPLL